MAELRRFGPVVHVRAEPNQHLLLFRSGRLVRQGRGASLWFGRLSAAVAQVPVEDIDCTLVINERSRDFQEVAVQATIRFRCIDPERAASRVNFALSLKTGNWLEEPLERVASLLAQRARGPVRAYLRELSVIDAAQSGGQIQDEISRILGADSEVAATGLEIVGVEVAQVQPQADIVKALQTPIREAVQQKADQASFERRALAVEKERAIKENELQTEIELTRKQEELIRRQGANRLQEIEQEAVAEAAKISAEGARRRLAAATAAEEVRISAEAEAAAKRLVGAAEADTETLKLAPWRDLAAPTVMGLAMKEFASKIEGIQQLNVSPDLVSEIARRFRSGSES